MTGPNILSVLDGVRGLPLLAVASENPFERFGVNWYDFASQAIAFLIIAWILNKFVFKTVMKSVEERHRAEEETRANNERLKQELQSIEEQRNEVMKQAREEADRFVETAKARMAELILREQARSAKIGEEMLAQAREDGEQLQVRLKAELRSEIAALVVNLTEQLTRTELGEPDRKRLLQAAIDEIAEPFGA